jgi:hypothetical protein
MIIAKVPIVEEQKKVFDSLKIFKVSSVKVVVGYYDTDLNKFIGGVYLQEDYPNNLVMEYYTNKYSLIKAIRDSFIELFKYKTVLTAKIHKSNFKSLKIGRIMGFRTVYKDNEYFYVEFRKEYWKFKDKFPLFYENNIGL